ncbi:hypothetical protein [Stenotrophomonas sp.]|uniref:hypothetical protein n=1 Tax=Stenotrophomonas sp. TaxID=69392 RepID=UPI002FC8731E
MSSSRSAIGIAALWATLCVVLLAAGWLKPGALAPHQALADATLAAEPAQAQGATSAPTLPSAPAPEIPASEPGAAAEGGADPHADPATVTLRLRRTAWVAVVPLWPADALAWQRMEPSLRLNPGHAPPHA